MSNDVERNVRAYLQSLENRVQNIENVVIELLMKLKNAGIIYDADEASDIQDAKIIPYSEED